MIRQAIERPVSTLIAAAALVVLGGFSLLRLPVSLLPAVERPGLEITATAEGRARDEMLDRVTRPLERRLAALAGVISVRTRTGDGVVHARVESEWQTDADRLRIEAERRLADLDGVTLAVELTTGDPEPIVEVAVLGGGGPERTAFARRLLVPELARLEGAGRVETVGLAPRHAVIRPRAAALAARGLTPAALLARLESVGLALPAGRARSGAAVRTLLVREEITSLAALAALRVPGPHGESVLGDLAGLSLEEVRDGSFYRIDGRDAVLVRVFRAPEANAVALARQVRARVAALGSRAGSGLRLVVADDRSREVVGALSDLGVGALLGLLLGTLAIRAFLGRWRPTLALSVVVPASLFATFTAFQLAGTSLDVVSLAGLALAAGMLVDSSIVVLEAIETARDRGEPEPVVAGTRQIALPVVAGFLTTGVVFLPLLYLQGLARAFFGAQAFAIVASLAASLLFSLTVTPVLAGRTATAAKGWSGGRAVYLRLLDACLARPALPVLAGLAVTALAGVALVLLPRELLPDAAARELVARYRLAPDLTPEAAERRGRTIEDHARRALGTAEVRLAALQVPGEGLSRDGEETGRLVLSFPDTAAARRSLPLLRTALGRLPDVDVRVEPRTSAFVEPIERSGRRLEVVALAGTPEEAAALAGRAVERLQAAGLQEIATHRDRPHQALLLAWDLPRLAAAGLDRASAEGQLRAALGDQTAGRLRLDGVEPEILVKPAEPADPALLPLSPGSLPSLPTLPSFSSSSSSSSTLPLGALARLTPGARPADLERQDGRPAVHLAFEGVLQGGTREPETLLTGLTRGAQEELAPGGRALELVRSFGQLRLALALSLVLVFLTLAALYESFRLPLVVLSTVPVGLGGALGLLLVTGKSLDVLSFLGLILLGGIVVNNAIVIVHRAEEHLRAGEALDAALRRAGAERYRPIVMTTLTTLAGMLPLALLGGDGAELRQSLAVAVLGGMVTSTFASLLLVPVLQRALTRETR